MFSVASSKKELDLRRALEDPANFLHSIDVDNDHAVFVRTDPQLLRDSSFIDGRTSLTVEPPVALTLHTLAQPVEPDPEPDRFLFNVSFCGSTLLSRLLDVPGRSLVLKEPMCLADLATWKAERMRAGRPIKLLQTPLKLAKALLRRQFKSGEAVTIKPGNWSNNLIDDLVHESARVRPVFMTISRLRFLLAVFRGGAGRMHHATKIAWHLAASAEHGDDLLREAVGAGSDPLRKAANLAVLSRYFQIGIFQRAARSGGWNADQVIDLDDIVRSPIDAAMKAAAALDLNVSHADLERNVRHHTKRYAKQPGRFYLAHRYEADDRVLLNEHRQVFDDALSWAEKTLGPQLAVTA